MNNKTQSEVKCDAHRLGPLRIVTNENYYDPNFTGAQFHIFTRPCETPGNLNNFAVAEVYNESDAQFIVHAVNCHDSLLEACKVACGELERLSKLVIRQEDREKSAVYETFLKCKAAISQAENHTQNL